MTALRAYNRDDDGDKVADLRRVAEAFLDARQHFFTADRQPDALGRTGPYRNWVRDSMADAGIPEAHRSTLLDGLRYHVSNVRKERLSPEELEALGLRPISARERSVEKRERTTKTLALFGGGGQITGYSDVYEVAQLIEIALRRVSAEAVAQFKAPERERISAALAVVCNLTESVRSAAERRITS